MCLGALMHVCKHECVFIHALLFSYIIVTHFNRLTERWTFEMPIRTN